jgi:hypothetical protein
MYIKGFSESTYIKSAYTLKVMDGPKSYECNKRSSLDYNFNI